MKTVLDRSIEKLCTKFLPVNWDTMQIVSLQSTHCNQWGFTVIGFMFMFMLMAVPMTIPNTSQSHQMHTGLDITHFDSMPIGHTVLKIYVPCKNFHVPSQYLYTCKAYVYCWKNKYMPRLKNHLPTRACSHKSLCALGQDLHAPGMP